MVNAQEWLNSNYPLLETGRRIGSMSEKIDLANKDLEGDLDLSGFDYVEIDISNNPRLGKIKNLDLNTIVKMDAQKWLNDKYSDKERVEEIESEYKRMIKGKLVITDFPNLKKVYVCDFDDKRNRALSKLEIINCPQLSEVSCSNGNLNRLIFTNCSNLTVLDCSNNQLTSLDLTGLNKLNRLYCSDNYFDNLDLSNCRQLTILLCQRSGLTSLDISNNPALTNFQCNNFSGAQGGKDNCLTSLDLSNNKELTVLDCSGNQLTKLDLSNQTQLTNINCSDNLIETIKLPAAGQEKLTSLRLDNNNFQRICDRRDWGDVLFFSNYSYAAWQDLAFLEPFINLKTLLLGNTKEEKIQQGIYNRFGGSLESLKNMKNLESLRVENTDIGKRGLEYLPIEKLREFYYFFDKRIDSQVNEIFYSLCRPSKENGFDKEKLRKFQEDVACSLHRRIAELQEKLGKEKKKNRELAEFYKKSNEMNNSLLKQLGESQQQLGKIEAKVNGLNNELTMEREEAIKALQKAQEWRERQLKEITEQKNQKITELETKKVKNANLQKEHSFYKNFFDNYYQKKKTELTKLKSTLNKQELEWLDTYYEANQETEKNSFVKKQLKRARENLQEKFSEKELELLLHQQTEINELEEQLNNLQIQENTQEQVSLQAQIQILPKSN